MKSGNFLQLSLMAATSFCRGCVSRSRSRRLTFWTDKNLGCCKLCVREGLRLRIASGSHESVEVRCAAVRTDCRGGVGVLLKAHHFQALVALNARANTRTGRSSACAAVGGPVEDREAPACWCALLCQDTMNTRAAYMQLCNSGDNNEYSSHSLIRNVDVLCARLCLHNYMSSAHLRRICNYSCNKWRAQKYS